MSSPVRPGRTAPSVAPSYEASDLCKRRRPPAWDGGCPSGRANGEGRAVPAEGKEARRDRSNRDRVAGRRTVTAEPGLTAVAANHDQRPELSAAQRAGLLRLLYDELDQAYRALDRPGDEKVADLRRRRARLGPCTPIGVPVVPELRRCADRGCAGDHRAGGDRDVDDAQDRIDDTIDRAAIGE